MTKSSKITRHLWTQEILFQWGFSEEPTGKWASDKTKWLGRHQCKAWWWTLNTVSYKSKTKQELKERVCYVMDICSDNVDVVQL